MNGDEPGIGGQPPDRSSGHPVKPEGPGIRDLLRPGVFRRLLIGQSISSVGDWVGTFALAAAAFNLTGSPTAVSGVLVIRLLPPLLAAPVGGVLADRLDRRVLMVSTNLVMAGLICLVPFVNLAGLYVIAFVSECFVLVFLPARDATIPELVPKGALPQANGLVLASSFVTVPVAGALFSGLALAFKVLPDGFPFSGFLRHNPLAIPFFFDAATFVFAAVMIAGIATPGRATGPTVRLFEGIAEAFAYARRTPAVRALAVGLSVSMFGGGVLFALGIPYIRETLGGGNAEFGFLTSTWGLGMAAGVGIVRGLVHRRGEAAVFRGAVAGCGAILVGMAFLPFTWLALLVAFLFGVSFSMVLTTSLSLLQRLVDERLRGRLVAGAHMLFRVSLAVGALGIGGAAGAIGGLSVFGLHLDGNQFGLLLGGGVILAGSAAAGGLARAATSPGAPPGPGPA